MAITTSSILLSLYLIHSQFLRTNTYTIQFCDCLKLVSQNRPVICPEHIFEVHGLYIEPIMIIPFVCIWCLETVYIEGARLS